MVMVRIVMIVMMMVNGQQVVGRGQVQMMMQHVCGHFGACLLVFFHFSLGLVILTACCYQIC
jgi:hypothetical protein